MKLDINAIEGNKKHPKCKGFMSTDYGFGSEPDCGYLTKIGCDECRYNIYGTGKKDPNAKKNWL